MTFDLPWVLLGLLLVPLLVWRYRALLAARASRRERLAHTGLVAVAAGHRQRGRAVAPVLLLGAFVLLILGAAGPAATLTEVRREGTVILAFDVSNSMRADDLEPTRMEAAKVAARAFVEEQPASVKIGVVAFSDSGVVTQAPTDDSALVLGAIDRMSSQGGTSLGQGIFASLKAIAGGKLEITEEQLAGDPDDLDIGYYGSGVIVLLSDGQNTAQLDPLELARLASVAGVRIDTVGVGSPEGTTVTLDGFAQSTALDEEALTAIADASDGTYRRAADAADLESIYSSIDLEIATSTSHREITSSLSVAALVLLFAAVVTSVLRTGKVVSA